jgi:foldase protein PrsA
LSYFRIASLVAVLAFSLSACGNEVPPNSVAKVDGEAVKKSEFDHLLATAARSSQAPGSPSGAAVAPDPPNYERCVKAKQAVPVPKGQKKPTTEELKKQCKQQYDSLKGQVMQYLITSEWLEREAEERDIKVSDETVRKEFDKQKKQSFPDDKAYQEFLKTSGQTEQDLLFRVRLDYISNEIRKQVVAGKGNVTDADVQRYYEKNKSRFAQPERRDLEVVLTKSKSKADQAHSEIRSGQSFRRVARRHSIDEASKAQGGKLPGVGKGQLEKDLDEAVFEADKGDLVGPVKTQFGYEVFRVTKITPASQQTLAQSKETIKATIKAEREQKALEAFIKQFRAKYREDTNCAEAFVVSECKNGPEPKDPAQPQGGQPPQSSDGR